MKKKIKNPTDDGSVFASDHPLLEANRELREGLQERAIDAMLESCRRSFGVDLADEETFDFRSPFFSWRAFREAAYEVAGERLMEANAENVFGQLLRGGINMTANYWYNMVQTNHELVGQTTFSTHALELHAPMYRGSVPRRVPKGGRFPEMQVSGKDIQIVNEKFGSITTIERELVDDDQTGQISQRVQDAGSNMRILEDAWFFQRFIGTAGSFAGDVIPASQTYPSGPFTTGQKNRPASYVAFNSDAIQAGDIALMDMVDPNGNKLLVNPNTLLVGTKNKFTGAALLQSTSYAATTPHLVGGTGGTSSTIGTTFAKNVLEGLYTLVVSRFLPGKAWALGEGGKGMVFQRRDATEMTQESVMAGAAFTNDEYRFKSRGRWEPDWIESLFWYLGNDGTV